MAVLPVLRLIFFGLSNTFAVIALSLAAHLTSLTEEFFHVYFKFAALTIATAGLHILSLPVLLIIGRTRNGAFTSMVVVELSWLFVIWVMWIATGADAANANSLTFNGNCNLYRGNYATACNEIQAIEAIGFINWLILLGYSVVVLVFAIKAASDGRPAWTVSVREIYWSDGGAPNEKGNFTPPAPVPTSSPGYPPASSSGYPSTASPGYPSTGYNVSYSPPPPAPAPNAYPQPINQGYPGGIQVPAQAQPGQYQYPQV